jgi:hypothetical protein
VIIHTTRLHIAIGIAIAVLVAAAMALAATPALASQKIPGPPKALGQNCGDVDYADRTQAYHNRAGVVFQPRGDIFKVWDNRRDNRLVSVWFNYAGVADKWKYVGTPSDGGQGPIVRNVRERYRNICFAIVTGDRDYRQSPIVRYTTRP